MYQSSGRRADEDGTTGGHLAEQAGMVDLQSLVHDPCRQIERGEEMNENVIEWISGQEKATVTLFRGRLRTKVLKLYDKEEVEILRYPE